MKATVIIPTKNEEGCIGKVLSEISKKEVSEIIVVDGNSTDNTRKEVKENLRIQDKLIIQKDDGYGNAFLQGFKKAHGDVIILMDGDGSHNPKDITRLLKKINQGYDFVMASRYIKGGESNDDTLIRFIGNKIFTFLTNLIHRTNVTDSLYLYTAIKRKKLDKLNLTSNGFEFCTEIVVKAHNASLTFAEIPVIERKRISGSSKVNSLIDGLKILKMILKRYD